MALIECPSCNKKISDKAETCSHCAFGVKAADADDILRKQKLKRFNALRGLQNQSMLAILLFVTGFGFMFWGGARPGDLQHNLAMGTCTLGFVWYAVNRVRIVIAKRFSQ